MFHPLINVGQHGIGTAEGEQRGLGEKFTHVPQNRLDQGAMPPPTSPGPRSKQQGQADAR